MDFICEYVKHNKCINFEDQKIQEVSEAVDILMKRFVERMKNDYPDLKVKELRLCGSMAEKTRLKHYESESLEYDYLAVLETWPGIGKYRFVDAERYPGSMFIEHDVINTCAADAEKSFLSNGVGEIFVKKFTCVQEMCSRKFCQRMASRNPYCVYFGCNFCTVYMKSGHLSFKTILPMKSVYEKLVFSWTPKDFSEKANGYISQSHSNYDFFRSVSINVDFHSIFSKNTYQKGVVQNIALFPMDYRGKQTDMFSGSFSWRKSSHNQETKLIKATSTEHKLAFMTLKYVLTKHTDNYPDNYLHVLITDDEKISQYLMKNIFLLHIRKCKKRSQTAGECLNNMIDLLSMCFIEDHLPHFLFKNNLLETSVNRDVDVYKWKSLGYRLHAISALSSISHAHHKLQDIEQDMFTILLIAKGSEIEAEHNIVLFKKRDHKELPDIT